jgi:hypothetical protein
VLLCEGYIKRIEIVLRLIHCNFMPFSPQAAKKERIRNIVSYKPLFDYE